MSERSVILDIGIKKAFRKSNFQEIEFNLDGSVHSFKIINDPRRYVRTYSSTPETFYGFLDKINYDIQYERLNKGEEVTNSEWRKEEFNNFNSLDPAESGDIVEGVYSIFTTNGKCKQKYVFTFSSNGNIPETFNSVSNIDPMNPNSYDCNDFGGNATHQGAFFNNYKDVLLSNDDGPNSTDIELIGEIAALLDETEEKTAQAFIDFQLQNIDNVQFQIINTNGVYSRLTFEVYKKSLENWLEMLDKYKEKIKNLTDKEKLFIYIDVMYRHNMLHLLTVQQKIDILATMATGALITWYFASWTEGFQKRELIAIKVVESVTNEQAEEFLQKLVSEKVYTSTSTPILFPLPSVTITGENSLYKALFYRFDDYFGRDNFTAFIKKIERLVLVENGIPISLPPPTYTLQELQSLTSNHFIWREKGPKKGRVTYNVTSRTNTTITFKERIVTKTELLPIYGKEPGGGAMIIQRYEEIPIDWEDTPIECGYFDLVTIHFFDNPSFVDLSTDSSYVTGEPYVTFAGFIEYILEKEDTEVVESTFEVALYAISLTIGFGELIAAIRTINAARAVLGAVMVASETAVFLAADTPFRNYIVANYPDNYNEILSNLEFIGLLGSLGTGAIQGQGILKTLSKQEACEFIGTARAVSKDSEAMATLPNGGKETIEEAVKRVSNELGDELGTTEVINAIAESGGARVRKYPDLYAALGELEGIGSGSYRIKFLRNFIFLDDDIFTIVKDIWLKSDIIGRKQIIDNAEIFLKQIKSRIYYLNQEYDKIAKLYGVSIKPSFVHQGINFVIDGSPDLVALNKAIVIAQDTTDVSIIANKLGIPEDMLSKAKKNYFVNEHLIRTDQGFEIGRFERQIEDVNEWERMRDTPLNVLTEEEITNFKRLIVHEYLEAELIDLGMSYRSQNTPYAFEYNPVTNESYIYTYDFGAHDIVPTDLGSTIYVPAHRINNPPIPDYNNLENIEEIKQWLINFYKL